MNTKYVSVSAFVAAMALLLVTAPATAELQVVGGDWNLLPDQPGQLIQIAISGGDDLDAATVMAEVTGTGSLPAITGGQIVVGTIFAENNTGSPSYDFSNPHFAYLSVATQEGYVAGEGTLATLIVDTTGLTEGTFGLLISGTWLGDTTLGLPPGVMDAPQLVNGSITIIPEPTSLLAMLALPMLHRRRRWADAGMR